MSIESVMPSNHLIFCHPLLFLPSIFSNTRERCFPNSFPVNWLFVSGGQSTGASALASVLPMNIQYWFPLGLTGLFSSQSKGLFKSLLQPHNLKASILRRSIERKNWKNWKHQFFFMVQLSHVYMTTRETVALTIHTFVSKVMSLLFNTFATFVIAFLSSNKSCNFTAAVTVRGDFGAQENKVCHCFHFFLFYLPWSAGTRCHDLSFFENWVSSQLFHSPLSPSSRSCLVSLHFLPCHLRIWGCCYSFWQS